MIPQYILGLDIGTSSVRAALYDDAGQMLPKTLVKLRHLLRSTADGSAELDAEVALKQIVSAIDGVLENTAKLKGEITQVASCCFWHSLVGVDAKGKPTTKVFTWADTRSKKYTDVLRNRFDESVTHGRTGARFHSSFWLAKLLWIRKENSEIWKRTVRWLSLSDYFGLKLFGDSTTSVSMASGTGIFDIRKCEWDNELLRYLKMKPAALPKIASSDAATFTFSSKWKKRWPRLANANWFPPIADGAANNIGSGCTTKSQAALTIGTSGAMRVAYTDEPPAKIPSELFCYRIDRKRVVLGGALSDGGNLYDLLKKNLRIGFSDDAIGKEMAHRGADAHGLTFMPFFFGERSTGYNENAEGSVIGLNTSHDGIDILQAAMESVAFRFAEIFDQLRSVCSIEEIVVSGGALDASPVWSQIIADVVGQNLAVLSQPEASMRGEVLLALESLGKIDPIESFPVSTNTLKFHPKCYEIYKNARKRHVSAYKHLIESKP